MIYSQCPAVIGPRAIQCVMFAGHKPLSKDINHNYGGIGPYTPGLNPTSYVPRYMHMPWWKRLLSLVSPWKSK